MAAHIGQFPSTQGWNLIHEFTEFNDVSTFSYSVDNSSTFTQPFSRVLYLIKYNEFSVWCEFDDHTSGDITKVGVPLNFTFETDVTNMNVFVNNPGAGFPQADQSTIKNRIGVNGRINFWPSDYNRSGGDDNLYDHDDGGFSTGDGYGSFQVFDIDEPTPHCVFVWNRWGFSPDEVGIGSNGNIIARSGNSVIHPDWTFTENGAQFKGRLCRIYVK